MALSKSQKKSKPKSKAAAKAKPKAAARAKPKAAARAKPKAAAKAKPKAAAKAKPKAAAKAKPKAAAKAKPKAAAKAKPKAAAKAKPKAAAKAKPKAAAKAKPKAAAKATPKAAAKATAKVKAATRTKQEPPKVRTEKRSAKAATKPTKGRGRRQRRSLAQRRGPDGQPLVPGEILLPGGPRGTDETQYFLRGCVAAEHPAEDPGVSEILSKSGAEAGESAEAELRREMEGVSERFDSGSIEPQLPARTPAARRSFASVVERAVLRRREIGAFLRGLDIGGTETSHMDPHGEGSLQNLMEWAARLEILADADEPGQPDYTQFHRVLDQLESNTEALIVDVELTLRRLRDRVSTR